MKKGIILVIIFVILFAGILLFSNHSLSKREKCRENKFIYDVAFCTDSYRNVTCRAIDEDSNKAIIVYKINNEYSYYEGTYEKLEEDNKYSFSFKDKDDKEKKEEMVLDCSSNYDNCYSYLEETKTFLEIDGYYEECNDNK